MDLSAISRGNGKWKPKGGKKSQKGKTQGKRLSDEEYNKRREEKSCFQCGKVGHFASACRKGEKATYNQPRKPEGGSKEALLIDGEEMTPEQQEEWLQQNELIPEDGSEGNVPALNEQDLNLQEEDSEYSSEWSEAELEVHEFDPNLTQEQQRHVLGFLGQINQQISELAREAMAGIGMMEAEENTSDDANFLNEIGDVFDNEPYDPRDYWFMQLGDEEYLRSQTGIGQQPVADLGEILLERGWYDGTTQQRRIMASLFRQLVHERQERNNDAHLVAWGLEVPPRGPPSAWRNQDPSTSGSSRSSESSESSDHEIHIHTPQTNERWRWVGHDSQGRVYMDTNSERLWTALHHTTGTAVTYTRTYRVTHADEERIDFESGTNRHTEWRRELQTIEFSAISANKELFTTVARIGKQTVNAIIDSGAQANFIHPDFAQKLGMKKKLLDQIYRVRMADGGHARTDDGVISHYTEPMELETPDGHIAPVSFNIMTTHHNIILGLP